MTSWTWVGFAAGIVLYVATASSVIGTLVVPRRVRARISRSTAVLVGAVFRFVARLSGQYETRDRILAFQGPVFLLSLLTVWIVLFVTATALLYWPFTSSHSFGEALTLSGSSFFTLGFAQGSDTVPFVSFLAAGTGLIVVALQIAYLPVIYGSFNRRETLVTMLASRAGSPAWGPELLARAELVDNVDNLRSLYIRWEEWAADLAESHTTYPVLIYLRSPDALRSWVTGLLAVLDAASLHLATRPLTAPPAARVTIRMGYVALREIAELLDLPVNNDPKPDDPIKLTRQEFDDALHMLAHAKWPMERTPDEAWVHYRGWRVNYESVAYAIADAIDAPPALWSGPRHHLPEGLQAPARPPHREPSPQVKALHAETKRRRAARGEKAAATAVPIEQFHRAQDADTSGDDEV